MTTETTLIIGASSEIAKSIAQRTLQYSDNNVIVVSRNTNSYLGLEGRRLLAMELPQYDDIAVERVVSQIAELNVTISRVFICIGVLHQHNIQPEKKLEDLSAPAFSTLMYANVMVPMLWVQRLPELINHKNRCAVIVFSARVGSISDNKLGGWYSYRASKAALNMMLKTSAVELKRRLKHLKLVSFHPGTTDTPLSKPFQANVPEGKLFTADFVAEQLFKVVDAQSFDGEVSYVDFAGKTIPW